MPRAEASPAVLLSRMSAREEVQDKAPAMLPGLQQVQVINGSFIVYDTGVAHDEQSAYVIQ